MFSNIKIPDNITIGVLANTNDFSVFVNDNKTNEEITSAKFNKNISDFDPTTDASNINDINQDMSKYIKSENDKLTQKTIEKNKFDEGFNNYDPKAFSGGKKRSNLKNKKTFQRRDKLGRFIKRKTRKSSGGWLN